MKLAADGLVLCLVLLSDSAETVAFFMDTDAKPVAQPAAALASAVEAGAGAVGSPAFSRFSFLKFILASLGIPVEHLIEGSRRCVAELGPKSVGAMKTLLLAQDKVLPVQRWDPCCWVLSSCPSPASLINVATAAWSSVSCLHVAAVGG
ncbi:secretoglobin family 3A member 1 [Lepus europaeus]|uniref:secretoglobin family 3A member 1 n=1 Tax=Lepus europaeus TaxID=9983 RepID=UPI002B49AFC4|nr:secretoglobin family 3A member 1 [Lepus europaeus]